jgi:hypothetical protein
MPHRTENIYVSLTKLNEIKTQSDIFETGYHLVLVTETRFENWSAPNIR